MLLEFLTWLNTCFHHSCSSSAALHWESDSPRRQLKHATRHYVSGFPLSCSDHCSTPDVCKGHHQQRNRKRAFSVRGFFSQPPTRYVVVVPSTTNKLMIFDRDVKNFLGKIKPTKFRGACHWLCLTRKLKKLVRWQNHIWQRACKYKLKTVFSSRRPDSRVERATRAFLLLERLALGRRRRRP